MYEEKSRGSGLESRKTRLKVTGGGTREVATAAVRGKRGRHASSGHGTVACLGELFVVVRDHWLAVPDRRPLTEGDLGTWDRGFLSGFRMSRGVRGSL
ncbi:hypothetical protein CRG98_027850 [Punica granatum]|uniref:Uncharacterized protein n=1 Tax=Punica granatum TaxID=22663 RepID=A0A2I0J6G3_PUNGR|nr:hypothetical protein CRG98_027850 [Punica granatum]